MQTDEEGGINEFVIYMMMKVFSRTEQGFFWINQDQWNSMPEPRVKEVEITRKDECLNEECKADAHVEIELEHSIGVDELVVIDILEILKEEIGNGTSGILIRWDTDESGRTNLGELSRLPVQEQK